MKTKNAERFFGRRGGRFVPDGHEAGRTLAAIHKARIAGLRDGSWPTHTLDAWAERVRDARQRIELNLPLRAEHDLALDVDDAVRARAQEWARIADAGRALELAGERLSTEHVRAIEVERYRRAVDA